MPKPIIPSMSRHSLYNSLRESCEYEVDKYYLNIEFTNIDPIERQDYIDQHFDKGKDLIEGILDQFRWMHLFESVDAVEANVTSWTHSGEEYLSSGDGGYLVVNDARLLGYLESYFEDRDYQYIRNEVFDWAIADMLVYTECRLMSLQSSEVIPVTGLNNPFASILKRKKKLLSTLKSSQPYANSVYSTLGYAHIDWIEVATRLEHADRNGVGWRDSIKYATKQLAYSGPG